jgi:U3 small nucleolar RNA-associated protein 19
MGPDPFLPAEPDPMKTNAIDSSLWELHSHTQHYHAPVSTLARIFEQPFTKPSYAMEDFLDHTYGTVRVPPLFFSTSGFQIDARHS